MTSDFTPATDAITPVNPTKAVEAIEPPPGKRLVDGLGDFIAERCITGAGYWVSVGELRHAYVEYCEEQGIKVVVSKRKYISRLEANGFVRDKTTGGLRIWRGIQLSPEYSCESPR